MAGYSKPVNWTLDEIRGRCRVDAASGCWVWQRATQKRYGTITIRQHVTRAHRLAFELANGAVPVGLFVCHRCDNPPCCNPSHLFAGSHSDNMRDAASKHRNGSQAKPETRPRGERHHRAKLTAASVQEIRRLRVAGYIYREIAAAFGISLAQAAKVSNGQFWQHVQ